MIAVLERFDLAGRGTTVGNEARGALATFLAMSYILFTNPAILSAAGVPFGPAVAGTALAAALSCFLMGWFANFPLALASGMGLNSFIAFQASAVTGDWRVAMGLVVIDGIIVLLLVLTGLREAILTAIPRPIKLAIGAGIGLFIAFIGLVNARIIVVPPGTVAVLSKSPTAALPPVSFGTLAAPETWVALLGLVITAFLLARRFRGALVLGIVATAALGWLGGLGKAPTWEAPSFATAFQADILAALKLRYLPLLLALVLVDFFDTLGTVTAVAEQAGLDKGGRIPRLRQILAVDAIAASLGGLLGVSSVTSYIESAAGVAEGARTGLHTIFVGLLFLLAVAAAPLAALVPAAATAPALILVGFLMCAHLRDIDFADPESAIPAFLTLVTIPLTYSISHGIGIGFLSFVLIKILSGKFRDVPLLLYGAATVFLAYFLWS